MKYVSRVLRWVEGGDCVKRWITWGISASVTGSADGVLVWKLWAWFTWVFHGGGG